jgi:hypothetical protein
MGDGLKISMWFPLPNPRKSKIGTNHKVQLYHAMNMITGSKDLGSMVEIGTNHKVQLYQVIGRNSRGKDSWGASPKTWSSKLFDNLAQLLQHAGHDPIVKLWPGADKHQTNKYHCQSKLVRELWSARSPDDLQQQYLSKYLYTKWSSHFT